MEHVNEDTWFNANMHDGGQVGASNYNCQSHYGTTHIVPGQEKAAEWHTFSE